MTRQAILDASEELFAERGYDGVTVAQIADAANVSVKTLFKYFGSKDDLAFGGEDAARDALLAAVRDRAPGCSAVEAVRSYLRGRAALDAGEGMAAFHQAFGDVPQLRARMLLMFERFEEALAVLLAEETGTRAEDPEPRLAAAQLVSLVRLLASPEARRYVADRGPSDAGAAVGQWIDATVDVVAAGLAEYAVRAPEGSGA
jgi:AcrR family transcriptional regulator